MWNKVRYYTNISVTFAGNCSRRADGVLPLQEPTSNWGNVGSGGAGAGGSGGRRKWSAGRRPLCATTAAQETAESPY